MRIFEYDFPDPVALTYVPIPVGPCVYIHFTQQTRLAHNSYSGTNVFEQLYVGRSKDGSRRPLSVLHEKFEECRRLATQVGKDGIVYTSVLSMPESTDFERYRIELDLYLRLKPPANDCAPSEPVQRFAIDRLNHGPNPFMPSGTNRFSYQLSPIPVPRSANPFMPPFRS